MRRRWTPAATKRTRRRSLPPSPAARFRTIPAGETAWRAYGAQMFDLEREEWADPPFSRSEMRCQIASARSGVGVAEIADDLAGLPVSRPRWRQRSAARSDVVV